MLVYEKVRQSFVAQKCGISATTFNAMMNGRRKMYAEDLRSICYALEVSPEEFIEYHQEHT